MTDTLTYIGNLTLAAAVPAPLAALNLAIPDLQARISALVSFSPGAINLQTNLALAEQMVKDISLQISLGVVPPSIDEQITIVTNLLAELEALLAQIESIVNLFAAAGVQAYAYDGTVGGFGAKVTSALSGGFPGGGGAGAHCNALVLATEIGATWTAMSGIFKVTP